jgi:hypothetical protein
MGGSGATTNDAGASQRGERPTQERKAPSVVFTLVYCRDEPHRIGERFEVEDGSRVFVGRSAEALDESPLVRARPGDSRVTGPLVGDSISRRQIGVERTGDETVVTKVGKLPMRINGGKEQTRAVVRAGDVVEIGTLHRAARVGARGARVAGARVRGGRSARHRRRVVEGVGASARDPRGGAQR